MNAFPFYAIWSSSLGTWAGGRLNFTQRTNKDIIIEQCKRMRPDPHHFYCVIESWGPGYTDKEIYRNEWQPVGNNWQPVAMP